MKEDEKDLPVYRVVINDDDSSGISIGMTKETEHPFVALSEKKTMELLGNLDNVVSNEDEPEFLQRLGVQIALRDGEAIKALCWKQPFASLMLPPWHKIETRTRRSHWRGLVLIVATASPYKDHELVRLCGGVHALSIQVKLGEVLNGHAIAIGRLIDCRPMGELQSQYHPLTYIKPIHHADRYAWIFAGVNAIQPIPLKGFQGWRDVDDDLRSKIKLL
jgi:hypothetical protein